METEVKARFDKRIRHVFMSQPQVMRFLLDHEKKPICISNLCLEIRKIELSSTTLNAFKYRKMIDTIADLFSRSALNAKEKELMPKAELSRREAEASKFEDLKADMGDTDTVSEFIDGEVRTV